MKLSNWPKIQQSSSRFVFPTPQTCSNPLGCCGRRLASGSAHPYKTAKYPTTTHATTQTDRSEPRVVSHLSRPAGRSPTNHYPEYNSALNPPPNTRPPLLTLPVRSTESPVYKYFFQLGKAYVAFYKNGLKGIYLSYKIAKGLNSLLVSRSALYAATSTKNLSRADLRLLIRFRADAKVLPLFILVFICCGEFTPLLVPWLTAIVPPTLHIPRQTQALRKKAESMRQQARLDGPSEWRNISNIWEIESAQVHDSSIGAFKRRLAKELGLYKNWWGKMPGTFDSILVGRRLMQRLRDLQYDDLTIIRDGGVKGMISEEVVLACESRGLSVEGKDDQRLRRSLEEWLSDRESDSAQRLVDLVKGQEWENWRGTVSWGAKR